MALPPGRAVRDDHPSQGLSADRGGGHASARRAARHRAHLRDLPFRHGRPPRLPRLRPWLRLAARDSVERNGRPAAGVHAPCAPVPGRLGSPTWPLGTRGTNQAGQPATFFELRGNTADLSLAAIDPRDPVQATDPVRVVMVRERFTGIRRYYGSHGRLIYRDLPLIEST